MTTSLVLSDLSYSSNMIWRIYTFRFRSFYLLQATPRLSEDKVKQCVDPKLKGEYPPKGVAKVSLFLSISNAKYPAFWFRIFTADAILFNNAAGSCGSIVRSIWSRVPAKYEHCCEGASTTSEAARPSSRGFIIRRCPQFKRQLEFVHPSNILVSLPEDFKTKFLHTYLFIFFFFIYDWMCRVGLANFSSLPKFLSLPSVKDYY